MFIQNGVSVTFVMFLASAQLTNKAATDAVILAY